MTVHTSPVLSEWKAFRSNGPVDSRAPQLDVLAVWGVLRTGTGWLETASLRDGPGQRIPWLITSTEQLTRRRSLPKLHHLPQADSCRRELGIMLDRLHQFVRLLP